MVTIFAVLKVAVMYQDVEHVRNATGYVAFVRGVQPGQAPPSFRCECPLGCCFGKYLQGYCVAVLVVQAFFETCLVTSVPTLELGVLITD